MRARLRTVRRAAGESCSSVSTPSTRATRPRCLRSRSPTPRPSPRRPLGACPSRASSLSTLGVLCALPLGCSQKHCAVDSALLRAQLAAAPHSVGGWERGQSGTGHWMVQATARVADSSGSVGAGSRKTSTQVRASTSLTRWRSLTSPSSEQRGQRLLLQHAAVEASRKEME